MKLPTNAILLTVFFSIPAVALDSDVCNVAANKIDDRIAQGNHPPQNIAIATQLRDSIVESCEFFDEATLNSMMQGLDQLLPGPGGVSSAPQKSNAERDAEREAQRAEANQRRAERDKQRAEERAREEAELKLVSDAARNPPTGRSSKGQLMTRPDEMWLANIVDWDYYENRARLLYVTKPRNDQYSHEEVGQYYYVVEFGGDNTIVQYQVVKLDQNISATAGLVRGRDEIVVQWHEGRPVRGKPVSASLERWSITGANLLSSVSAPQMTGPRGFIGSEHHFQLVTARAELLYATTVPLETGPTPKTGVTWMLASLDGDVLDQALIVYDDEKVSTSNWFHTADGGAGLILDVLAIGDAGVNSSLKPANLKIGDTVLRPRISSEQRLYVVGEKETGGALPTVERSLWWQGRENVDFSFIASGESERVIGEAEGKYQVRDSRVQKSVAGRNRTVVEPSGNGHAVLLENSHRDDAFPPTTGLWLREFQPDTPRRDTYLELDAKHLKAHFDMLASGSAGNLYVAGAETVLQLNSARNMTARAESRADSDVVKAIVAGDDMVWLFGENIRNTTSKHQIWVERIQF